MSSTAAAGLKLPIRALDLSTPVRLDQMSQSKTCFEDSELHPVASAFCNRIEDDAFCTSPCGYRCWGPDTFDSMWAHRMFHKHESQPATPSGNDVQGSALGTKSAL
jgi:hypothetical protein